MICSRTYPNLRPIALLLPGTVGAKVAHYWGKRDMTETHAGMPIIAIISPFQVRGIHLDIILQFPPRPCVPAPSSDIYRPRNSAPETRAPIFHLRFLHEDRVQSGKKSSVEQRLVCSKTYPNINLIRALLPGTPSWITNVRAKRTPGSSQTSRNRVALLPHHLRMFNYLAPKLKLACQFFVPLTPPNYDLLFAKNW